MGRTKAAWVLGAALALVSGRAAAVDTKGDTGGKGGAGPGTNTGIAAGNGDTIYLQPTHNGDLTNKKEETEKPWELGASFETHRLIVQDELVEGVAAQRVFNSLGVYGTYRLTPRDSVGVSEFLNEDFEADPGETGVRAGDIAFRYTRLAPLPRNFLFSATASLSVPTSLSSQKAGTIVRPGLVLSLDKKLGRYVDVGLHAAGGVFIDRFAEAEGGAANSLANVGFTLTAEVIMPFHEPLSIGASVQDTYVWSYQVQSGDQSVVASGVVNDATYPNQPVQQLYGGEVYARYTLPALAGLKSDFLLSFAQGDPDMGYTSYLHDGVGYAYLFFRQNSEVYASFSVRY
jgi:hypothetical protein